MSDHSEDIALFIELTGVNRETAQNYLEATSWDVEAVRRIVLLHIHSVVNRLLHL